VGKEFTMSKDPFAKRLETIGGWIQTHTGKQFWPMEPNPDAISIIDIAVSLSRINRFTGHTLEPYSVAQHSCYVCDILPEEHKRWGLLHDAHEAYVNDMVSPVKKYFPLYQEIETKLMAAMATRFDLPMPVSKKVVEADYILLATEKRDIMGPEPAPWGKLPKAADFTIKEWTHDKACKEFIKRFEKLFGSVERYQ
jgi:5'-deoxynucleotidase YfbR-like HD superfamily hydrolase